MEERKGILDFINQLWPKKTAQEEKPIIVEEPIKQEVVIIEQKPVEEIQTASEEKIEEVEEVEEVELDN